ncbi:unnamed protein product [Closterium sp. NIES-65]|nr:unnamed protein product [Closterium sp. NIES-65]
MRAVLVSPGSAVSPFLLPSFLFFQQPPLLPPLPPTFTPPLSLSFPPGHRRTTRILPSPHLCRACASLVVSTVSPFPPSLPTQVQPFLPDGHFINTLFLPRIYAPFLPDGHFINALFLPRIYAAHPRCCCCCFPLSFFRCPSPSHPTSSRFSRMAISHSFRTAISSTRSSSRASMLMLPSLPTVSHPLPFLPTPSHLQPFLPDGHFINALFLPRIYAVLIPAAAAVLMLGFVLIFFAAVLMGQKTGKAKSS